MSIFLRGLRIILLLAISVSLAGAGGVSAAPRDVTITVTTKDDEFVEDGDCALREAIYAANWNTPYDNCPGGDSSGMDTIVFAQGEGYVLGTWLPPVLDAGPLTIGGGYMPELMGNLSTQVLIVENGANLTLTNVMISGGYVTNGEDGAGLYNNGGTVTIDNCYFIGNTADGTDSNGGAIYNNAGSITISNTTFQENGAYDGGGIYNYLGTLNLSNNNFDSNSAQNEGGGISAVGQTFSSGDTFEDNVAMLYGGAIYSRDSLYVSNGTFNGNMVFSTGGAIMCSYGTCTIESSSFEGSVASSGGAICTYYSNLYVSGSLFSGNAVWDNGGAIELWLTSDFSISTSTFEGNSAEIGGGLRVHLSFGTISDSLIHGNYADQGGGIYHDAYNIADSSLTLERTTLWENDSLTGGAIYNTTAHLMMFNDTLASNTAENGAGVYNTAGLVELVNTTLAHNSAVTQGDQLYNDPGGAGAVYGANSILAYGGYGHNCYGTIIDSGANIDSGNTCGFDPGYGSQPNTDPLLGVLQDNGGPGLPGYPTLTFALQNPSPAINHANFSLCPTTDQRTYFRRIGFCDIGAFEAQPYIFYIVSGDWQSTYINTYFAQTLVVEVQDFYGTPLGGVPITFAGPASGASIANNYTGLVTDVSGLVSFQAMANGTIGGPYEVVATHSADGIYTTFHLTNLGYETTTTLTSDEPDPSEPGQEFVVTFDVTSPNGTPEGWVTVTVQGRSEECTGWVSSGTGWCSLSIAVPGSFTLEGEFGSNSNFTPSSDTETHTVEAPPGWQMSLFLPMTVK